MFVIYVECKWGEDFTEEHETAEKAFEAADRLRLGPFAQMGGIVGFKIVDTETDTVCFVVEKNKIIFPSRADLDQHFNN